MSGDGGTESGGVRGVRAWAGDAAARADELLPGSAAGRPTIEQVEAALRELLEVARFLGDGEADEPLRAALAYRRGALLALRGIGPAAVDGDLAEAEGLLRAARPVLRGRPGTDAARAALYQFLAMRDRPGADGRPVDSATLLDWQLARGAEHFTERAGELVDLLVESAPALTELPDMIGGEEREQLLRYADLLRTVRAGGPEADAALPDVFRELPEGHPLREGLPPFLAALLAEASGDGGATDAPAATGSGGATDCGAAEGPGVPSPEEQEAMLASVLNLFAGFAPDMVDSPEARRLRAVVDDRLRSGTEPGSAQMAFAAHASALSRLTTAMSERDPAALDDALGILRGTIDTLPPDDPMVALLRHQQSMLLRMAARLGGSEDDQAAAEQLSGDILPIGRAEADAPVRLMSLHAAVQRAAGAADADALADLVHELEALSTECAEQPWLGPGVRMVLGEALMEQGRISGDPERTLAGVGRMEEELSAALPFDALLPWQEGARIGLSALRARLTDDPEILRRTLRDADAAPTASQDSGSATAADGGAQPDPDVSPSPPPSSSSPEDAPAVAPHRAAERHWAAGTGHVFLYGQTGDPGDLDRAIEELERARATPTDGERSGPGDPDALWRLASAYQSRWALASDLHAATGAARESLRAVAANVLLQSGAEHGLRVAREGTQRATEAAGWAASNGWVEQAVDILEFGRAMVLHAASVSTDVPGLLTARGRPDLADAWRARAVPKNGPGTLSGLPSTLRRQALETLGFRSADANPFPVPTVDELRAGIAAADADALVHLIPSHRGQPGYALVLGPDVKPGVMILPHLAHSRPLERYLDAAAARGPAADDDGARIDPDDAERTWEDALEKLCDWAWEAAMGPLVRGFAEQLGANPHRRTGRPGGLRLVLVACGRLGVVPWHAARFSPEPGTTRHFCSMATVSYAASGAQFLRSLARAELPVDSAPVLIADPTMDLVGATDEVIGLYKSYYPGARLYGEYDDAPVPVAGAGTPAEVLALFAPPPDGAGKPLSLLHVASHASAGTEPTVSALELAPPDGTEPPPDGAAADRGLLTVSAVLDGAAGTGAAEDTADGPQAGPLVVLSACETDLSRRDHDEALTLATAFVARGARDVVGSRWTVPDNASAVLMAVFHHLVAVDGLSPPDALCRAQLWMLNPARRPPPSFRGELLREMTRPGLERIAAWAGFTHQGHPGNHGPRSRAPGAVPSAGAG
ncbi:CHAT domain-containing protein [Streptomyces yaizuensis]|uniref:CHAT domain-containing protein n=1 Tax=Streptomyces yaizuensis TaxID=2989713 RepID=A0ABQ5NSN9_9ACTN|nr:CHAT domain-containing protein [Streptomyces sp. YSPA8]GLF93393.1 CHAT domain-containing protein [Streptomyces sp. YSPA8]